MEVPRGVCRVVPASDVPFQRRLSVSESSLLALIGGIYDAAIGGEPMADALGAIGNACHCVGASIYIREPRIDRDEIVHNWGFSLEALRSYESTYSHVSPFHSIARRLQARTGSVLYSQDVISPAEFHRTQFYNEYFKVFDVEYTNGMYLEHTAERSVIATFCASESHGPFTEAERALFAELMPHLRRGLGIWQDLEQLSMLRAVAVEALDKLRTGVVVLGRDGRLVFANQRAEQFCQGGNGLRLGRSGIVAIDGPADSRLQALVARGLGTLRGAGPPPPAAVSIPRAAGRPIIVTCVPVSDKTQALGSSRPRLMLFVRDPEDEAHLKADVLQAIFGLTLTEALVAMAIARGRSLAEVATDLGHSVHTSRNLLKRAFAKTGTRSQAELASLVLRSLI